MRKATSLLVPALGFTVVMGLAVTLIFQVVMRPWANADSSWRTHLNLEAAAPEGYTRTAVSYVGEKGPLGAWGLNPASDVAPEKESRTLYIAYGCASCHGLNGKGGLFASDLTTARVSKFTERVRNGMGPMPAFSESDLGEEELREVIAYLVTLRK